MMRAPRRFGRVGLATAIVGATSAVLVVNLVATPVADAAPLCATPPTSGTTAVSGVVNTYYPATSSITAGTVGTTVTVGTPRGGVALAVGDLVLVMQMQGADINSANSSRYGDNVNNDPGSGYLAAGFVAGQYEFATVRSATGSTIGLSGAGTNDGLVNSYTNAAATTTAGQRRFQLVRVPQYFDATFSAATPPAALAWDGSSGGVLVLDAAGAVNLNGATVSVNAQGFRPGLQRSRGGATGLTDTDYRTPTSSTANGQKAEGVAGSPVWRTGDPDTVGDGYPNGDFGRGAPGNAGGGGSDGRPSANDENTGGGGGGNGGAGGIGGNAWNSADPYGGFGGVAVTAGAGRVVMGGGGGAGSDNNQIGSSSGGAGGGIVLIRADSLSGNGTITANGGAGGISGQDGGGGGGAGGSIVVVTAQTGAGAGFGGLTARANGGAGGNTTFGGNNNADRHGPGGGGGGGRIFTTAAPGTTSVTAGVGGTHTPTAQAYGAAAGSNGSTATGASLTDLTGANTGSQCIDIAVAKTISTSPVVPGSAVTFSIVVTNKGPYPASGTTPVTVADSVTAQMTSVTWTCSATSGSSCAAASGSGNTIATTANLARNGAATYTVTGTLAAGFTGTLSNTATASGPSTVPEITPADNSATATAIAAPRADLRISKTDGTTTATPGTTVSYTVVVTNAGPSTATNATVTDALPAGATSGTWSCTSGACSGSGTLPMSTTVTLPPGQTATYAVNVVVPSTATGSLSNTATVTAPAGVTDPAPGDNASTDADTLTPRADLTIAKTDGVSTRIAGQANPYTITVTNAGPSAIVGATVADTFPADYTGVTWTCTASSGSSCPSSGSGNINANVTVAAGGSVVFAVTGTISPTAAAGTLSNTATVSLPGGSTDPTPGNNTALDTTTITRSADLRISKTDGAINEVPGTTVTYTIVATNDGPSTATGATVTDTLPATLSGATWTCVASSGSTCPASGTGNLNAAVTLAPSGTATFTLTATIAPGATGTLVNTATVTAPTLTPDPNTTNNSSTDTDTLAPSADLTISKTDGQASDTPGTTVTYTIIAGNLGPSTATNATVADTLPAVLSGATWTCVGAGGATCPASGTGNISATVALPPGGTATFTVVATIAAGATGTLGNTATVTAPGGVTDPAAGNNTAVDATTLTPSGNLSISKTDGATTEVPGTAITYTIVAGNSGPSVMNDAVVTDPIPATVTGATWTCTGAGGGTCTLAGSGDIADTVDLPVGASVTYTVTGTVAATATGSLVNTATITAASGTVDPDGSDNTDTDTDTLVPTADLSITKTDGVTEAVPGETVTYTIVAANAGPSAAPGTAITDTFPAALTGASWTCTAAGGATCPAASGSGDIAAVTTLPVGGSLTYTVTGTVAPDTTGTLTNTATVTVGSGVTDPDPSDNIATDSDTVTPQADLVVTKTDGVATAVPGSPTTYTIVATNTGPSTVTGASVVDPLPAGLTGATWTCTATAGSSCPAGGSGGINASVTLAPSGSATFTLTATIAPSASGTLSNTVTVTAPGGVTDPTPGDNTDTDDTVLVPTADLSVTKTDGAATEIPGTGVVYTVVVSNAGPSDVTGAPVTDTMPAALTSATWACSATPGSSCGTAGGTGDIATTVDLLAGGSATITITGIIDPAASGNLVNTVSVAPPTGVTDPDTADQTATDTDTLVPTADLSITKDDGLGAVTPGQTVTYTVVASNAGPSTVIDAPVTDTFPAELTGVTWTCAGAAGGTCSQASGSGALATTVTLPSGGSATFTVTATVAPSAVGPISNSATVAVPSGVDDPDPSDNSATDVDTVTPTADVSITKDDGVTQAVPGDTVTYTIVATNAGPSSVTGVTVADTLPAALTGATWTCAAAGGGTCTASGTGDIADTIDLPAGASVTFTLTATVDPAATGTLSNTATVSLPGGVTDPDPGDNTATDTDDLTPVADLSITKDDGVADATPGGTTSYTVTVTNAGPSAVVGAPVADALPVGATAGSWTCAPAVSCAATSGSMPLATTVDLAPGATATFTVDVDIAATATGTLANTATVDAPAGVTDPDPGDNADTDSDTLTPVADLSISKTDGLSTVTNGDTVTYTVVVTNPGPSRITGATVSDSVPAQLTGVTWTCTATGGSTCAASGTGDVADTVALEPSTTATYTITGTVSAAATGTITNTATVAMPGGTVDPTPGNNEATDITDVEPETDLTITKSNGTGTAVPGTSTTYTVVVTNDGPADVAGATVTDSVPAGATAMTWTCAATGGGACGTPGGTGAIAELVDLPVGGTATYTVVVDIDPSATAPLSNTASVAPPSGITDTEAGNDSATDTDLLVPAADVSVTKTDGVATAVPGESVTYTIVVANAGPSDAPATAVVDPEPAGATFVTWSCTAGAGANCAAVTGSGAINTASIDPAATADLVNTVTATASVGDPDGGNDSATDTDTLGPVADLSVTKTNGVTFVVPGTTVTYTVVATNDGPSDVVGATVTDAVPAILTSVTWTCAGAGGGTCTASGNGDINDTVDLPVGATATYTVVGTVPATATGTIDNTVVIAAPGGVVDPDPGNDSATETDPLALEADLSISKDDGVTEAVPGDTVTYTIVASNDGPSAAPATLVEDIFPAELGSISWTCTGAGGAACPAATGTGDIADTVDLPVGGSVTYVATATVDVDATGTLANTATVSTGPGVGDPAPGDNAATDTDTITPEADLVISKTDGATTAVPGESITYTVAVTNAGPSAIAGATVTDDLPATLGGVTWTCTATAGSVCPAAGAGDITGALVSLLPGGTVTFTIDATIAADATGTLTNTATVALPGGATDPTPDNNEATDADTLTPEADLTVGKDDGTPTATPGGTTTYTITVTNDGPSAVVSATVDDALPTGATAMSWTCAASPGSSCGAASGSGAIAETVDLLPAGTAVYTVVVDIAPDATGTLANTATVSTGPGGVVDPDGGNDSATDADTLTPTADLSVTKSDGATSEVPGTPVTYTIVVSNAGPSAVVGATVTDLVPAELTGVTWTCLPAGGGDCTTAGSGDITDTVDLPVGATATYTLAATVAEDATGTLDNTVTVAVPGGVVDPDGGNDSATDSDTLTPTADLSVTKSDGATSEVPGTPVTYTIVVSNAGPSAVVGAAVTDLLPAALENATWTCTASPGSSCPPGGAGDINTTVDLAAGGTATFELTADVAATATVAVSNTVTVGTGNAVDPDPADNTATDTDTLAPSADLSITKTDGLTAAQPGDPVTYTVVVANAGPSAVADAPVTDTIPVELGGATWTCAAGPGGTCDDAAGTGDIATTVDLAPGGSVTITVTASVLATVGAVVNLAEVDVPAGVTDPDPSDNAATDTTSITPTGDLSISKTDGLTSVAAGETVTYTILVSNAGPSTIADATVTDTVPAVLTGITWTCTATAGSSCEAASGAGDLDETVTLAAGGVLTYTVTGTVPADAAAGTLTNSATVTQPGGTVDPTPGNNTDDDDTGVVRVADLSVTKSDGTSSEVPGTPVTYTIVVANAGPSDVAGATVADVLPPELSGATWTCAGAGGGTCTPSGGGDIADTVDLPAGASITYTLIAAIAPGATADLVNTAGVTAPPGVTDPEPANDSATDTDTLTPQADLSIVKDDGQGAAVPGEPITYTVTVANAGPSSVVGASVTDTLPAALTGATWTCTGTLGGDCAVSGSGDIADSVDLPVGATVTYTLTATVAVDATGTLDNTAVVAVPGGVLDPVPDNDSSTDTDTLTPQADLSVAKSDGASTEVPGTPVTYTITVANAGPSDVAGAAVADVLPATLSGATWTCTGSVPAATCAASGSGDIGDTVDLPAGTSVTYTLTADIADAATGTLDNTATVTAPAGVDELAPADNTDTDSDTLDPTADLSITKTDGLTNARPGDAVTYTIVVANAGPSAAPAAVVADPLPAQLGGAAWTCAATPGSACPVPATGTGDILTTVDLAVGGSVTFTVTGTVTAAATGVATNTASVDAPAGVTDPDPSDNDATDTTTIDPLADLVITKTDGLGTAVAGEAITYTIVVTNAGPSAIADAPVDDTLPAALTGATWTCAATAGSGCDDASGSGDVATTVDLASGGSSTFTVDAVIDPTFIGGLSNTATVTMPAPGLDPTPGDNTATDDTIVVAEADLSISKTDGSATAVPGGPLTYTIVVTNGGPSDVTGATVADALPTELIGATWTCAATGGGTCTASGSGDIADVVDLPVGATLTYIVGATVAPDATGTLTNTVTVATPAGVTERTPADNTAIDTDTLTPEADLAIVKTDGVSDAVPGGTVTYSIVVTNQGPSDVVGATVTDVFPAAVTAATWTCTGSAGATCTPSGTGDIADTVDIPAGGDVTYVVTVDIDPGASGTLVNTATVAVPPATVDPDPSDNSSTDTDGLGPQADLSITKTDGSPTAVPGEAITYEVVATNAGPSDAVGTLTDVVPATILGATWTCTAAGGATCAASGTGSISETVTLPVGGTVTVEITGTVDPAATGSLVNTASIVTQGGVVDPDPSDDSATDTDGLEPAADLTVTKTDGLTSARPGDTITYTVVVSNGGPSDVVAAPVDDPMPAGLSGVTWTCTGSGGGTCTASGTGDITDAVDLPAGGDVTYTVVATVAAGAGTLTNTVTVDAPAGVTDPTPGDNAATDVTTIQETGDLSVVKTDGATSAIPGDPITYTITISNAGPSDALGVDVVDTLPAELVGATWTCTGSVPAVTCAGSGTGDIVDTVDIPGGESLVYTLDATVAATASGTLVNTAAITPPAGFDDTDPSNDTDTDTDTLAPVADLSITKTDGVTSAMPGTNVTYSIVVANGGPSDAVGTRVVDTFPTEITAATWTCTPSAGSACTASGTGSIDELVDLGAGSSVTFTVTATIAADATGTLENTATVTAPAGTTDSSAGNDSATDTDMLTPTVDLSITKTDGVASAVPGEAVTYTVVVTNAGPSSVSGARVTDTPPAALTGATWTCGGGTLGGTCGTAAGAGAVDTTVDLPAGATVTLTLTATVDPAATADVVNTATVTAPSGVIDTDGTNDSATDTDTLTPTADLAVTKSDGVTNVVAGDDTTYTITITNAGPSDLTGATVADPLPTGAASAAWSCTGAGGAACAAATGSGAIATTVDVPVGGTITISSTVTVDPAATGLLVNTVTATVPLGVVDADPANDSATDTDTIGAVADLSVTKTDGLATALPGDTVTYTIVVTNAGPSAVVGALVADPLPAELENATWTCAATGGSCAAATGTGGIATTVDLVPAGTATFILTADVVTTALGTIANTATVSAPGGVVDPDPSDNAATDSTTISPLGDVSVSKTDGLTTAVAGTALTYVVVVTNPGPSQLDGVRVVDPLPAALAGATWTCAPAGGSVCAASGTGSIDELVDLSAGGTVTYTIAGTVDPAATGTLTNTATVTLPAGAVDPTPANNAATDTTGLVGVADLAITKTDGAGTATPGDPVSYTIVATNTGPSDVVGARVTDTAPAALGAVTWTCAAAGGATCAASGTGSIDTLVDVPVGGTVTFTFTGTVDPAATGNLVNTATIAPPFGVTDPAPGDNSATDTDALTPVADIAISKDDGRTIVVPGTTTTYTIVVSNLGGPSTVTGVQIDDPLPAGATGVTWTCSAAPGLACGAASGTGAISTTATVAPAADVTYTVVLQTAVAAGTLTNVVTATVPVGVTDPDPSNNAATDVDTLRLTADLSVTKLASQTDLEPGDAFSYTVVVTNGGPNPLIGVTVDDPIPAGLTNARWACLPSAGATCSDANGTGDITTTVALAVGASATFVVNVRVGAGADGTIVNTATVAPPAGAFDPDTSDNSASATVTVTPVVPPAALELTKTAVTTSYADVGDVVTYGLVATNTGGVRLTGVRIDDDNADVGTCTPTVPATLDPGDVLTCTATHEVTQADLDRGSIDNTATATGTDPAGDPLTAISETVTVQGDVAPSLSVTKSTSTTSFTRVGDIVAYTIVATNTGNVTLDDVTISDTVATVRNCPPRSLAPGQSMACSATRSVTQADLDRGRIDNIATAEAVSSAGTAVEAVSGVSNLVTVRRALLPGTGGDDDDDRPLPGTGSDIGGLLAAAAGLVALGFVMTAVGRRRRPS